MRRCRGFTLLELLVVVAIIGILAVMIFANLGNFRLMAQRTSSISNMRQIGVAFYSYAADHDQSLPRRVSGTNDKWPRLLADYLGDVRVYAATGDRSNYLFLKTDPLSNDRNHTSYIMNGYNDVGAYADPNIVVRLPQIPKPSQVILLGTPKPGSTHFYMDMVEGENGNHVDVLNLTLYGKGSVYLFGDGSARFLTTNEYHHALWLVNPDFVVP